ncbi:LOW QUALITY PROTEIN: hypothetical protein Cgig2_006536 [Carnegiea gigantea]|uniref:Uncharacterized protein n=1 Tax=Carnegiea gigantea TaxID=171969 RepID=A0A9Q1GQ28_9CARY|nr:LOW QUALITY PROTEIN: hypothetical protein Cgig2_006536 [Carnegiea gigantea]
MAKRPVRIKSSEARLKPWRSCKQARIGQNENRSRMHAKLADPNSLQSFGPGSWDSPKKNDDKFHNEETLKIGVEDDTKGREDDKKKPIYKQQLRFVPVKNFTTLRSASVLVKEELAGETSAKATNNWKGNYHNKDKKDNDPKSKKVYTLDCYTKYTPSGSTYTQALEHLLSKDRPPTNQTRRKEHLEVRELGSEQVLQV